MSDASSRTTNALFIYGLSVGAGLALLLSCIFTPESLPNLVVCPFRHWTGLLCPGCGLTHSLCCISHGDFSRAWTFNPFGYVFYALALLLLGWPLLVRFVPRLPERVRAVRAVSFLPPLLVALMLLYGAARICAGW